MYVQRATLKSHLCNHFTGIEDYVLYFAWELTCYHFPTLLSPFQETILMFAAIFSIHRGWEKDLVEQSPKPLMNPHSKYFCMYIFNYNSLPSSSKRGAPISLGFPRRSGVFWRVQLQVSEEQVLICLPLQRRGYRLRLIGRRR